MGGVPANGEVIADRCPSLSRPSQGPMVFCFEEHNLALPTEAAGTGKSPTSQGCILTFMGLGSFLWAASSIKKNKIK